MLKSLLDAVMHRRAHQLMTQVGEWLPANGPALDLGSGTGHFAARLQRELEVVTADVTDIHVAGPAPVLIADGTLPFPDDAFTVALLLFMLGYPDDPARVLSEASRVSGGSVILVQTLYAGRFGRAWHGGREFFWTRVAFQVSRMFGYVPPGARFSMCTLRFYTASELQRVTAAAGLRIRSRRERPVLPGGALVVAAWRLERDG